MFERLIAFFILVVISTIFLIVILFNILFSGWPIFFSDKRMGLRNVEFSLYKFRTMYINKGPKITVYNDIRITKFGQILRKYKIDEWPQLLNIIKGDMQFIGPRPEAISLVRKYPIHFKYLDSVKPGLSDISSIIFKDESKIIARHALTYEKDLIPIKNILSLIIIGKNNIIKSGLLFLLSICAIFNHKLSLKVISSFFLPYNEVELRNKLNYLLSENIF